MSLKSKIEAVIYASEEPVTLQQLVGLLAGEAQAELDGIAADQASLPLDAIESDLAGRIVLEAGTHEAPETAGAEPEAVLAVNEGEIASRGGDLSAAINEAEPGAPDNSQTDVAAGSGEVPALEGPPAEGVDAEQPQAGQVAAEEDKRQARERERAVRDHIRRAVDQLIRDYADSDRGIEIREVASGFRMGTKPEYHDAVRGFVKSLKPALKLTLPALETLAVVAYKQPVTAAEISEIRGVDSAGVLGGLMTRKLIATAGRKQVIGRPMLYKTTRDFLLRFGLKDVNELPSMEEFERMAGELAEQEDLPMEGADAIIEQANARGDAEMIREANAVEDTASDEPGDAETAEAESGNDENDQQQATAESAAGGTDEAAEQQDSESASQPGETEEVGREG